MMSCAYIGILERQSVGSGVGFGVGSEVGSEVGSGGEMLNRKLLHEHWIAPIGVGVTCKDGHALGACTSCPHVQL